MNRAHRTITASIGTVLLLVLLPNAPSGRGLRREAADVSAGSNRPNDFDTVRTNLHDYIWPTDASMKVTSAFAEYRSNHFHGGIDISTNGHAGYNVYAVRDGYVCRIRISPTGYGKMLFVRHPDGYASTYAHLKTFSAAINKVARDEQLRRETYAIDLPLGPGILPVRKGDLIAYSGNTGFGPPHLHFELRDENLNPVNPLLCPNYAIKDDIPPFIRRLAVMPLDATSMVDGERSPRYFSRFPRQNHHLIIPETIRLDGEVGFGLEAGDLSEGTWSRAGIHGLEFYLDDSLRYTMELNRLPAEETKLIDLHYDLKSLLNGRGKFQKLFIDKGNTLPFYNHLPEGSGVIHAAQLAEGKHAFRIVCTDNMGNSTELQGTLTADHPPAISILGIENNTVNVSGDHLGDIARCYLYGKRSYQTSWTQHTLPRGRFSISGSTLQLPVDARPYEVIKVIVESSLGSRSRPEYYFVKKPPGPPRSVHISVERLDDCMDIRLTTPGVFTQAPATIVTEGNTRRTFALEAIDPSTYEGMFVPADSVEGVRTIQVEAEVNGREATAEESFTLFTIPPDRNGSFRYDSNLMISYDSGAVFRPLFMQIGAEDHRGSRTYDVEPQDVLLNGGIRFTVTPASDQDSDHLGLYFRTTGGWALEAGRRDQGGRSFTATLSRTLGELALLSDDEPPTIGRLRVQPRRGMLTAAFRYYDNLSGVDPDEIKSYIDDKFVIPEIDGEHHRVSIEGDERLSRGRHTLLITVKDRAGNGTRITRTFSTR